jgi:hypothetical protein
MALNNVPLTGQTLNATRVPINQNFSVIDTAFQVDHIDYNIAGQGQHNKVSFPVQNPIPAPQAGIVQLYSVLSAITNEPELVFTHQAGSTAPNAAKIVEFTSAGWANPGWTRLPSGILLKWHAGVSFASVSTVAIDLNVDVAGSPNFTNVFAVFNSTTIPGANYNNIIGIKTIVGTVVTFAQFGLVNPPAGSTIAYLAIGM